MAVKVKKDNSGKKKNHIRTGDIVYVIAGKEKGKTGKIIKLLKGRDKALVEKLNIVKRHSRPSQKNPTGGIIEKESPIHVSNLMIYDVRAKTPVKVGRRVLAGGEKVRYSRKSGEEIKK